MVELKFLSFENYFGSNCKKKKGGARDKSGKSSITRGVNHT